MAGRLTQDQVEHFRREGYVIFSHPVFPEAKFNALRAHFEEKLARLAPEARPEAMDVPHFSDPSLFQWLFADEVLDMVESIVGPDIALFSSHFICKPKGDGKRVPWHEDSSYWKGMMEPMQVVTVWLAIDPSVRENGCMKVIPQTQHGGYSDYEEVDSNKNVFGREIVKRQRDDAKAVHLELEPNQASLHDGRIMHASDANTSTRRRCGYTMRYVSTRVRFAHDTQRMGSHRIYLARGRDHAGNRYADPTKVYAARERRGRGGH